MKPIFVRPQKKQEQGNPLSDMPLLFDAALTEFADKSFDAASLNDIIKKSGLSKGSFYHKFNDKLDLYLCLMDIIAQKKAAFTTNAVPATDDFFEALRFILRHSLEFTLQEPRFYQFWHRFLAEDNTVKEAVQAAFPQSGDELGKMIESAWDKGQLGFPAPFVAGVVNLLISQLHTFMREDMSFDDILALESNLVDMLQHGLAKT